MSEIVYAIIALVGISAAFLIGLLWVITSLMRSKSSKVLDAVKRTKQQLIIAATPGHLAHLFRVNQFIPGVLETSKFNQRVGKKRKTFYEPEKSEIQLSLEDINTEGLSEDEKKQSLALTQDCLNSMLKSNTEKLYLEEGIPVTLALEDKVITAGVKGIGSIVCYEKLYRIDSLKEKIAALKDSQALKEVGEYLESVASQVTLINIDVLRNYFDSDWDQTDDEAQKEYYYTMGYRDGHKNEKGTEKLFIYGGIAIGIVGIVGGAIMGYLGGK